MVLLKRILATLALLKLIKLVKAIDISNNSSIFTEFTLKDLKHVNRIRSLNCGFRIYNKNTENILNIPYINTQMEPIELHENKVENLRLHSIKSKYLSCCWNIIFVISKPDEPTIQESQLGNSIYDQFLFISENGATLEAALTNGNILNKVTFKHGMFLENQQSHHPKYLLEPNSYTGSFIKSDNLKVHKYINNLQGKTLQASFFSVSPFFMAVHSNNSNNKSYGMRGSFANFTLETSKRANFTFNFEEFFSVSEQLKNGTWTGHYGEIVHGKADFTPVAGYLVDRYYIMTYLTVTSRESIIFCVKEPQPVLRWQALVFPLSKTVWILTLFAFASFVCLFTIIVIFKLVRSQTYSVPIFLEEGIFLPIALFLEQNIRLPIEAPARITAISLIWFAFVIGMFHKTNLVGFITFPEKQVIPRSFKQLHEHKEYAINLFSFSSAELYILNNSPSPIFKGIVSRLKVIKSLDECVKLATKDKTACIMWKNIGVTEIMKQVVSFPALESLYLSQDEAFAADLTSGIKRYSIYYETLNRYAGATRDAGLFSKWIKDQMIFEKEIAKDAVSKEEGRKKIENNKMTS